MSVNVTLRDLHLQMQCTMNIRVNPIGDKAIVIANSTAVLSTFTINENAKFLKIKMKNFSFQIAKSVISNNPLDFKSPET